MVIVQPATFVIRFTIEIIGYSGVQYRDGSIIINPCAAKYIKKSEVISRSILINHITT